MKGKRIIVVGLICCMMAGLFGPLTMVTEAADEEVQAVITQLEAIDSLQTMQDKRSEYKVKNNHYDINTTDTAIITEHENARAEYDNYVSKMFAARLAAKEAYEALTKEQQGQIDASLVAKLNEKLTTVFKQETYSVTPADDEYIYEAVQGATGLGYEVSNHMVAVGGAGNIPQTFILVDTSDGKTSWIPSGKYVEGESNYFVTYCCDVETPLEYGTDYKRVNLEDSNYYGENASSHIRAILQNSYPYVTLDEMKANLKADGLNAAFVDSLTRADIISAVQMSVWAYANADITDEGYLGYFASVDIPKNTGIYFTPIHDYTTESWDWFPGKRQRSYDAKAEYRVNNLAHYLCSLPGIEAKDDEIIISEVKVARAELIAGSNDTYNVGMYVYLNGGGNAKDSLKITVSSYSPDGSVTGRTNLVIDGQSEYELSVKAKYGDTIKVVVEGTQYLGKGVYFYEPEGGRDVSQSLVGVAEGQTKVRAEEEFVFDEDIDMGLRIYKTANETGLPISDITFDIYKVELAEGESLSENPTNDEVAKYAVEANKAGSIITDETGYGFIGLDKGTYLVVEQHNKDKVAAPVDPFYFKIPMDVEKKYPDGTVEVTVVDVVSVYPKNTPVEPPEPPPIIPPTPDDVKGKFEIVKHDAEDESIVLEGAEFAVYRPATESDTDTKTVTCDGVEYVVVPVMTDGAQVVLKTDENGHAVSPEIECGTYFLVEKKAPVGYNKLEEAVAVTVVSGVNEKTEAIYIANEKGVLLPETGGIGARIFYIAGSLMMLAAVVFLVTKKRMK